LASAGSKRSRDAIMGPASEHLDRHGLGFTRPDPFEVGIAHVRGGRLKRCIQHVEVAHHSVVVELLALYDHFDSVIVRVQFALRPLHAGHHVQGAHVDRCADFVHGATRSTGRRA